MTPAAAPSKWLVLALVGVGVFMATLDSSIVNVSLPAMARYFGVPLGPAVEWVVIAYLVVVASLLMTIGRVSDILGRKIVWATGLVVFTVASAVCGATPSLPLLIVARGVQGVGGALLMAISPALLTSAFPPEERGRAVGYGAVVVALGVTAGPTLGGIITEHLSWRWIFYINLPIGIAGLIAALRLLPADRPASVSRRFDPLGAVLLAVALAALTAGMSMGNDIGWRSPLTLGLGALALVAIGAFLVVERRHPSPVVDLSLFSNRIFAAGTASLTLSFLASFAMPFLLPFYFQELRGFDPAKTGLLLTPLPLTLAVVAPLAGRLADRIGSRLLTTLGMTILCLSLMLLAQLDASSSELDIVWRLAVGGVGQGLFQSPNNSAILGAAPRNRQGIASGILATARVVGQSLGVALAGAVFTTLGGAAAGRALAHHTGDAGALATIFLHGFHAALWVSASVAAVSALTSLMRGPST